MPNITLPDGKKLNFEKSITGTEVAEKISKLLIKIVLLKYLQLKILRV